MYKEFKEVLALYFPNKAQQLIFDFYKCPVPKECGEYGDYIGALGNCDRYYWNCYEDACFYGYLELAKALRNRFYKKGGKVLLNRGLYWAARGGHMDIVRFMVDNGAEAGNWGLEGAAEGDHVEIARWLIEFGADNFEEALVSAARRNNISVIKVLVEKGAKDVEEAYDRAKRYGFNEICEYLYPYLKKEPMSYMNDDDLFSIKQCSEQKMPTFRWCDFPGERFISMNKLNLPLD